MTIANKLLIPNEGFTNDILNPMHEVVKRRSWGRLIMQPELVVVPVVHKFHEGVRAHATLECQIATIRGRKVVFMKEAINKAFGLQTMAKVDFLMITLQKVSDDVVLATIIKVSS